MSGISATDFTEGPELFDQEKYWSQVSIANENDPRTHSADFAEQLSEPVATHGIYAEYRLEDVSVRVTSDAFRRHQVNEWNRAKKDAEDKQRAWTATAIGSAVVTAVGGLGLGEVLGTGIALTAAPYVLGAGVVALIASGIFVLSANAAMTKAQDQSNRWSISPMMKIAQERKAALENGFPYIYSHNLKLGNAPSYTALLHPQQVAQEYKKYFEAFCKKLLSDSCNTCKAAWMISFMEYNPLSRNLMLYGLGEVPERLLPVLPDFDRLESFLKDIKTSYGDLRSRERELAQERINSLNSERAQKLQPYVDARETALKAAKAIRDQILERHPLPANREHQEAKRNFDAIKKSLDDDFNLQAAPINKIYDGKISAIEKERDSRTQRLKDQESQQLVNNYNAARDLLIRADRAWKGDTYQPVNFQQYFPWQAPAAQPVYFNYPVQPTAPAYQPPYGMQQPVYPQVVNGYIIPPPQNPAYQPYGNHRGG